MRTLFVRFAAALLLGTGPLVAQEHRYASEIRAFEEFAVRQMEEDRMPGLSVAFEKDGFVWARGFGFADLENRVPASEKSSYRMASVTKPMTAVAALRLAEMGKLNLDADVQKYVSSFPDKGKRITVRQLLAHLGGISHYKDYSVEARIREPKNTREAIAIFEKFDLVNEPGSAYRYSSYGYNLAGAAIEGAAGKSFGELLRELVWEPAGMSDSRMDDPHAIIPNRVQGYRLDGNEVKRSEYVNISSRFAAGGTRSTVVDLIRFVGALRKGKLLRLETLDGMWRPAKTSDARWTSYGLGWSVVPLNGHFQVNHSGSQEETRTLLLALPRENLTIAFASNFEDADFSPYRNRLYHLLTGEVWNAAVYAPDPADSAAFQTAEAAYDAGGLYFEKHGKPAAQAGPELTAAFRYWNEALRGIRRDPKRAKKTIAEGVHPATGQPTVLAGSWIWSKVAGESSDAADRIHRQGPLALLAGYARLAKAGSVSRELRLEPSFQRRILDLARVWEAAWTSDAQLAFVEPPADEEIANRLARHRGARIAPSYAQYLVTEAETSARLGKMDRAARLGRIAAEAYPENHSAAGVYGVLLALQKDRGPAVEWLRRSLRADSEGYATARRLAGIAREVAGWGREPEARALLEIGLEVHPRSEELSKARDARGSKSPAP